MVKNPPANAGDARDAVQSLGLELHLWGCRESDMTEHTFLYF